MSCKAKSPTKSLKFQPMPMAALMANLKTLPATLNHCDSSDSSDESCSPVDYLSMKPAALNAKKHTVIPKSSSDAQDKEKLYKRGTNYRVHVLPTIVTSTTTSQAIPCESIPKRAPLIKKKESARCLFPEPSEPAPKETSKLTPTHRSTCPPFEVPTEPSWSQSTQQMQQTQQAPSVAATPSVVAITSVAATPSVVAITSVAATPSVAATLSVVATPSVAATRSVAATPSQPQGPRNNDIRQFKAIYVKGKKYLRLKKLGVGGSSEVYKVLDTSSFDEYALKCVNLATDREMAQGYLNEIKLLRDLQKSDRVVKLYEYEYDKTNKTLGLVLEVGETDLACFLRAHRGGTPPALVLHYWEEMLRAVQQIHQHGIVHADLKPANFLLVSGRLKLIDFGISSAVSSDATSVVRTCGKGTFSYISPEALGGDGTQPLKVSFYSDIWSLGCILYSLVYGHTPFAYLAPMVKLITIRDPNHRIAYPPVDNLPPSLITALKQCLRYDAHSRPTATELLEIKYLTHDTQNTLDALLTKIRQHLTPQQYSILQNAIKQPEP